MQCCSSLRHRLYADFNPLKNVISEQDSDQGQPLDSLPELVEQLQSRNDMLVEVLAQLATAFADAEERIGERIKIEIAAAESRIINASRIEAEMVRAKISENVAVEAGDLRQIGHMVARKMARSERRIRCVFLVHAIESWDAQIDVYEAMRCDDRFDPIVASINRIFPGDSTFGGEEVTSAALDRAGVTHLRLGMEPSWPALDILRALAPDVIFRQSQWDADIPPAFHTSRIGFARICSVPYGMSIVGKFASDDNEVMGAVSAKSFDQYYHRMAWRVFCETQQTRDYFVQFGHSDPAKFVVSGYPKLARLLKARDEPEKWPIAGDRRFRVIWAPHHSIGDDWLGFGTFDRIHQDFLHWARECSNVDFVLKPHPALFANAVKNGAMAQEDMDTFLAAWQKLPNCVVELGTYSHLFAASDMMVTDGLSFFTEYPIFQKPLIFIDSGRHVPMNALGEAAMMAMQRVSTFDEIRAAIESYAGGAIWPLEEERQALLKILFPGERQAAAIILDSIAEGFTTVGQAGS